MPFEIMNQRGVTTASSHLYDDASYAPEVIIFRIVYSGFITFFYNPRLECYFIKLSTDFSISCSGTS